MFFWTQTLHFPGTTTAARQQRIVAAGKVAVVEENREHSGWVADRYTRNLSIFTVQGSTSPTIPTFAGSVYSIQRTQKPSTFYYHATSNPPEHQGG